MTRKMYEPTKNQERKWAQFNSIEMPTDEQFKARWAKSHHGKIKGWGIGKRNFISSIMTRSRQYQLGIWQGRVDKARGLDYSERRGDNNTYNLGYYRVATFVTKMTGMAGTRQRASDLTKNTSGKQDENSLYHPTTT